MIESDFYNEIYQDYVQMNEDFEKSLMLNQLMCNDYDPINIDIAFDNFQNMSDSYYENVALYAFDILNPYYDKLISSSLKMHSEKIEKVTPRMRYKILNKLLRVDRRNAISEAIYQNSYNEDIDNNEIRIVVDSKLKLQLTYYLNYIVFRYNAVIDQYNLGMINSLDFAFN